MSLLTSILGSVLSGGGQQQAQNPLLNIALGMLSNGMGGAAGGGAATGGGAANGLASILGAFQQGGLGHVADSWIGNGQNLPVSGDQLSQILGSGQIGQIAQQLGLSPAQASSQLAEILPGLVDKLTPHGNAPAGGLGDIGSMLSMLQGAMK